MIAVKDKWQGAKDKELLADNPCLFASCLLSLATCLLYSEINAQSEKERWLFGTGITYCSYVDNLGLNLNVTYRVFGNLHIGSDFSALLSREQEENGNTVKRKELEYNLNSHYLFKIGNRISIYPLTGINWSKVTIHPKGQDADVRWITALNTGGGVEVRIKNSRLFFESKWVSTLDKYDVTAGLLFPL